MTLLKREIVGPNPVLDCLNSMLTFLFFFFSHFFLLNYVCVSPSLTCIGKTRGINSGVSRFLPLCRDSLVYIFLVYE